ncbi:MAG: class I SAM-dependent methyltransferase [Actinomycetota bacterium]
MDRREFDSLVQEYKERIAPLGIPVPLQVWYHIGYTRDFLDLLGVVQSFAPAGCRLLDFGSGLGFFSCVLAQAGFRARGVDLSMDQAVRVARSTEDYADLELRLERPGLLEELYAALGERWPVELALYDGGTLPFGDGEFEAVVAHAVLEHVPESDLDPTLDELARVLAPGGHLFVFRTPRKGGWSEPLAGALGIGHHENVWTEDGLAGLLERHGLDAVMRDVADLMPDGALALNPLLNAVEPVTRRLERALLRTRMARFANNMTLVVRKV